MNFPKNALEIAAALDVLPEDRKKQILEHLAHVPESRAKATVDQLLKNGGPEAEFVAKIFGRPIPKPAVAPVPAAKAAEDKKA